MYTSLSSALVRASKVGVRYSVIGESGLSPRESAWGTGVGSTIMIRDLTSTARPVKKHSKIKENSLLGPNFFRLRRA